MVRNLMTSNYMNGLRRIRALFVQLQPEAATILSFPPKRKPVSRAKTGRKYGIGKGGLLESRPSRQTSDFHVSNRIALI